MLDPAACDEVRPPRWRSSLAVFRYDPAEEYQPYEDDVVSYLKVTCTLTPYQPELDLDDLDGFVPPEQVEQLEESFPTYGAILQVGVAPTENDLGNFPRTRYPYILNCEPKKRELFEAVTQTGEVLFGSSESLTVGKSATSTSSTERYDMELGGGGGASIFFGLVEANGQSQKQEGTIAKGGQEVQNVRTTDSTTERRELQSHTTQLSQMYNLFQAFHVGTNRALFLIEPRPHVLQTEATFINGPRALEGMQEVFLVIVRPKKMKDFCVSALLETAHLSLEPIEEFEKKTREVPIRLSNRGRTQQFFNELMYPDPGYVLDVDHYNEIEVSEWLEFATQQGVLTGGVSIDSSGEFAELNVGLSPGGQYDVDLTLYMKKKDADVVDYVRTMFLSARDLCCCPVERRAGPADWVTSVVGLGRRRTRVRAGLGSSTSFLESRRLSARIHQEMLRSFRPARRYARGEVRYQDSDAYLWRVADLDAGSLLTPLADSPALDRETVDRLQAALGEVSIRAVVDADTPKLSRTLGLKPKEVGELKRKLLSGMRRGS